MAKMMQFMTVHKNPGIDFKLVQSNWQKMANMDDATWVRTYFNKNQGIRYCIWLAHDKEALIKIFNGVNVNYESILQVEETVPDLWGKEWESNLLDQELL
ncbi:hypothetical protein HRM2_13930 [Desulforapulum autotrophicum HRM2]|uniref:DUF4242 domain-containing protein n=1 Tax=Desulforapulum autotrophicum (strain ATCC 43914 / DSM 3382 / VKM B-1955 / HRM2) TaxID=177437 RepID=C0Q912_DESAH|nr:DUF4242 domain-containing protein [Desulforapulum autotrophicum]ACN14502.1 hypothetical protein HRM2_13930 [Desulforapulum autotrophicum HRM2]